MSQPTYDARAIVLRKTKLGESDLILTLLAEDGSQMRAVAKGARKPASSFAARLELYSVVDLLVARGRSLDIVKEARLVESNERLRRDIEHAAGAAPMAELLDRVTQMGLENPRLFALTRTALSSLGRVDPAQVPAVCAAHLLKTLAFAGLRPSLDACVSCGRDVEAVPESGLMALSYQEGGAVCAACRSSVETVLVPASTVAWCRALLSSTFAEIEILEADPSAAFSVLRFCQQWVSEHVGANLKSLNFLFTCGLFMKDAGGTREEEERGMYRYTPRGVCSRAIDIDLDGDKVARVEFVGGCDGNLKAVSRLIEGMTVEDVAAALEGNTCGRRATSCADQLVKGLREARQAAV